MFTMLNADISSFTVCTFIPALRKCSRDLAQLLSTIYSSLEASRATLT
jgi:hypothetical protein